MNASVRRCKGLSLPAIRDKLSLATRIPVSTRAAKRQSFVLNNYKKRRKVQRFTASLQR